VIRVVELFSGIGAQRAALERLKARRGLEYESMAVCEIDPSAMAAYEAIFGPTANLGDIRQADRLPACDLVTYSFPCQDLSLAGKLSGMKEGSGTRSSLLWEVGRLLRASEDRPEWLVMENVPTVISKRFLPDFRRWLRELESLGYASRYGLLNASDFGVPQNRRRCFCISRLVSKGPVPDLPKGFPLTRRLGDLLEDDVPARFYLTEDRLRGLILSTREEREAGRGRKTDNRLGACVKIGEAPAIKGYCINRRIYSINASSPTVMTSASSLPKILLGQRVRRLTPRECWRLMDRTDREYDLARSAKVGGRPMSDAAMYRLAGNSIVVAVLESVFENMFCPRCDAAGGDSLKRVGVGVWQKS
jgi:DNA (cytosine-5)-methyltransferase 1